ncbi:MAG: hypothetical protein ACUVX1_15790 [Chloroflexota bacterium]
MSNSNFSSRRRLVLIGIGLLAVCAVALASYLVARASAPDVVPAEDRIQTVDALEPTSPWRFKRDTGDIGVKERWFDPAFDDSNWELSAPGKPWSPEYLGVAWYRASFTAPAEWGTAYLGVADVDENAQLWIDGVLSDWNPKHGPASTILTLPVGRPVQLTFRVVNSHGAGGIRLPVRVSRSAQTALPPARYLSWLAAKHPNWPMPEWTRGGYYAWTFTGVPGTTNRALIDAEGTVAPWATAPTVSLWAYDSDGGLLAPKPVFSLVDDSLPIPQAHWEAAGLEFQATLFAAAGGDAIHWQVNVTNKTSEAQEVKLFAVVRPIAIVRPSIPEEGLRPVYAAGFDQEGRLWLDGQPFMEATPQPTQAGVGTLVEVLQAVQSGSVPILQSLSHAPAGDAAAASAFVACLAPGETYQLSMSFPAKEAAPYPTPAGANTFQETRQAWQGAIDTSHLLVPDDRITKAYPASASYLLLALTPDGPRPGPLAHAKLWVRDAAFIGDALLQIGQAARVKEYLPLLFAHQEVNGRIPPIIGNDGPEDIDEWDAQGQAIHAVAALYRYEKDKSLLQHWEPNVKRAAEFIRALRAQTRHDPPATRGLLPPSSSAEDLGPAHWHHYWDSFWGVVGLEEAAFIEDELGHSAEASWLREEADELRQSIRSSVESVMGPNPAYIPNGPEDLTSSAMARGTSVSLYPLEVFSPDDPLIIRSFETYYEKWIKPNNGGYVHCWGHLWPYGGLGLARDYLRLGRQDILHQILGWTLSNQTLSGTYAWAEQVSPIHGGITGGDMPHAWAAASLVTLVREMLVISHQDRMELFAGVPASWLQAGNTVGVRDLPTEFGTLTALIESDLNASDSAWQGALNLTISGTAQPPGGFTWKLLKSPTWVDGPPGTEIRDGCLFVPGSGGTVRLGYNIPPSAPATSQ